MKIATSLSGIFGAHGTDNNHRNHTIDRSVVRDFEILDFAGMWYEIARINNHYEREISHVSSTFMVNPDGGISLRTESFDDSKCCFRVTRSKISVPDANRQASMKTSGMPFTDREINILEVDEGYNFALVGGRSANRLWILSRAPYIPQDDLRYLIARALERGYDISNLVFPENAAAIAPHETLACAM